MKPAIAARRALRDAPDAAPAPPAARGEWRRNEDDLAALIARRRPCLHHLRSEQGQRPPLWPRELETRHECPVPLPSRGCPDEDHEAADHTPRLVDALCVSQPVQLARFQPQPLCFALGGIWRVHYN